MAQARRAADGARGQAGPEPAIAARPLGQLAGSPIAEWALIVPDPQRVRSTRRLGFPITLAKRALMRALRQHHDQVAAQQSRFNAHVAAYLVQLDERVSALEREREGRGAGGDPEP